MRLRIDELLRETDARLPVGTPDTEFEGAFVDSRMPVPGALFVGVRGERADGGQHAPDALRGGAAATVVGESAWRWIEGDVLAVRRPVIVARDPVAVLQAAGRLALARSGARVVAITGAVGKTTTKDILLSLLRAANVRAEGTPGNRNTEIGVPLSLLGLSDDVDVAVLEMGMRGTGQIAELAALAPPDVACITSVGPVHLELLGTVEAVAAAKAELIAALRPGGVAVVPRDEPLLEPHVAALDPEIRVERFSEEDDLRVELNLRKDWERLNAAAAMACCRALGAAPPEGTTVTVEISALRGQEWERTDGGLVIEDCYNANPLGMRAALVDLAARRGPRVAVLADMMELGPEEARYHREVGELVAELGIERLIAVGERAAAYVQGATGVDAEHIATVDEAVEAVPSRLGPEDIVLLKGSRSMALERVADALREGGCPES